jgi:diphthamide synthase subunit DPH2
MATKDISQLPKDLEKIMSSVLDKEFLVTVAEWMRDTIYKRTKSGKGLNKKNRSIGGATNDSLKKVSDGYKEWRKGKITGPFPASGNKSNLTLTGELLESIEYSVKNNVAEIFIPEGKHSSGITLHELLDRVEKVRPFFGLSNTEVKILDSMIRRMIRDRLRKLNQK